MFSCFSSVFSFSAQKEGFQTTTELSKHVPLLKSYQHTALIHTLWSLSQKQQRSKSSRDWINCSKHRSRTRVEVTHTLSGDSFHRSDAPASSRALPLSQRRWARFRAASMLDWPGPLHLSWETLGHLACRGYHWQSTSGAKSERERVNEIMRWDLIVLYPHNGEIRK